jgi:hypothetical protein
LPILSLERPLSPLEETFWLFDRLSRFSFVMVAEVAGPLTEAALRTGLDALQGRHPLLRARIEMEDGAALIFRTADVPPIPLRIVDGPRAAWVAEAERDQQNAFPTETGPLARCTLIRHGEDASTVLFAFHHCAGDGLSGVWVVRDLLQALGDSQRLTPLPLPDPRRNRPARSIGWFGGVLHHHRLIFGRHLRFLFRGYPRALPLDTAVPPAQRCTRIIARELPAARVTALVERAHQEQTTVHGALCAAQLLAVASEFPAHRPLPLAIGSAVNVRAMLAPAVGDDLGIFVAPLLTDHRIQEQTDFWDLARDVRRQVAAGIGRAEPLLNYVVSGWGRSLLRGLVPLTETGARTLARFAELGGHGATGISNLGVLDIPTR